MSSTAGDETGEAVGVALTLASLPAWALKVLDGLADDGGCYCADGGVTGRPGNLLPHAPECDEAVRLRSALATLLNDAHADKRIAYMPDQRELVLARRPAPISIELETET